MIQIIFLFNNNKKKKLILFSFFNIKILLKYKNNL